MPPILRLLRPKQWTKNFLVFAAYIFSGSYQNPQEIQFVLIAFLTMCAASSATYIINDYVDRNRDKAHPTKKNRPLASGAVPTSTALFLAGFLLAIAISASLFVGIWVFAILAGYLVLQILYNVSLKHIAIADVFTIALGFILRAAIGAEAMNAQISGWLVICTAALALMLGFSKRREEFVNQETNHAATRESLTQYNQEILDIFVILTASLAAMSYSVYSLQSTTAQLHPGLILTVPFVLYGICRYLLVVFTKNEGGEPAEILLKDKHVIVSVVGFLAASIFAMTGGEIPIFN